MNKKTGIGAAVIVVLGVAYVAASWWLGGFVENAYSQRLAQAKERLGADWITQESYRRGIFTSTHTMVLKVPLPASGQGAASQVIEIHVRDDIRHGPVAGGQLAAAVDRTRIERIDGMPPAWRAAFKLDGTLQAETVFGFDGGYRAHVTLPGGTFAAPDGDRKATWQPARYDVQGTAGNKKISGTLKLPGLTAESRAGNGQKLELALGKTAAVFDFDASGPQWLFPPGHASAQIDRIDVRATAENGGAAGTRSLLQLAPVNWEATIHSTAGLAGYRQKWVGRGAVGSFALEHIEVDEALDRLDEKVLADAQPALMQLSREKDPQALLLQAVKLEPYLRRLADAGPSYALRLQATLNGQPGAVAGRVSLDPAPKEAAGAQNMPLPSRLQGAVSLHVPKPWLPVIAQALDEPGVTAESLAGELAPYVAQGLLLDTGDAYTAEWHYEHGRVSVNGNAPR